MNPLLLVSIGGVAGTLSRYAIGALIPSGRTGTLVANLFGVGLAAALLVLMERRGNINLRLFLLPGFASGLTTFSAVAIHSIEPAAGGLIYLAFTVVFSLLIITLVIPIARRLIPVHR
jgi:fluoride exporter